MSSRLPPPAEPRSLATLTALPLRRFLATEVAGGVVLLVATVIALVWANSPWRASYRSLWSTELSVRIGHHSLGLSLQHWVNDGLMTVFFLVVGLEIKRELVRGELRDPRRAALPAVAALGGMVVPAAIYAALNAGGSGIRGWGIPMATDIAFALGVVALLGRRIQPSLKLFLLALAIVDDVGAIVVIAVFYSGGLSWGPLALAAGLVGVVVVLQRLGVTWTPAYVVVGIGVWLALHAASVHATLAGVLLGLLAPAHPSLQRDAVERHRDELADVSTPRAARTTVQLARQSVPVVEWLEHALHPWSSFGVVPVFALANAGVPLGARALTDAASSPVTLGVVAGLVVGKTVGISLFAWLAWRLGIGVLPEATRPRDLVGIATVAGIGFTVSLFLAGLAVDAEPLRDQARVGILTGSALAGGLGSLLLVAGARSRSRATGGGQLGVSR